MVIKKFSQLHPLYSKMWIVIGLITSVVLLIWFLSSPFYWSSRKVPYLIPLPIFGNFLPMMTLGVLEFYKSLNKKFPGQRFYGMHMFIKPILVIKDPELIQRIMITDFEHFTSHGLYANQERDPACRNLFHVHGQQWKEIRSKLSPYFSPAKVKVMLRYAERTLNKAINVIDKDISENRLIEMQSILMNITINVTTQAVFGIETDTFENKDSIFSRIAHEMFGTKITTRVFISMIWPRLYEFLNIYMLDMHYRAKFTEIVQKAINYRKKENIKHQDYLQAMMHFLENYDGGDQLKYYPDGTRVPCYDMDTLISQAILLYAAGVETSALTMTYLFYEIAKRPDIQEKCRKEINAVINETNYIMVDDLHKLTYLNAVIQETLRLHAPLSVITRECTRDYKIPDTNNVIIKKGELIMMSPNSSQIDPNHFPEPEKFDPERFLDGNKTIIKGSFYPFGLGPRTCLGMGLANGEMKLVAARLLHRYTFKVSEKTNATCHKYLVMKTPVNGMWLKLSPFQDNQ